MKNPLTSCRPALARRTAVCLLLVTMLCVLSRPAAAAETALQVVAPNAVKEAISEIAARFHKETGHRVTVTWGGSEAILRRITSGEVFDVVVTTSVGVSKLAAEGKLVASTTSDFSRSAVAAAVRSGLPRPDVSTIAGLRQALLDARLIAISSGASGREMEQVFVKLGIADQLEKKIVQPPSGAQIGELLARGDADLGFQQVTELLHAKGIDYLGPLPDEVQKYTVWSAAQHVGAPRPDAAAAFMRALLAPESVAVIRRAGLEPIAARTDTVR
jgi:molybdate transport system substrate-binding protein